MSVTGALARHLSPGQLVAVGDGAGSPIGLGMRLAEAARSAGGVRLLLGWCLAPAVELGDAAAFSGVRTIMGGYALRGPISDGQVRYVPARYGHLPALLAGPLRPDVLFAGVVRTPAGLSFATEVGWQQAAVASGALVLAEVNEGLAHASATAPLPEEQVVVIDEIDRPGLELALPRSDEASVAIGARVAPLIGEGATLALAPGAVGEAVLAALDVPVRIRTGSIGDGVAALDRRGLLIGEPVAAYVVGTSALYEWADGRPIVHGVDITHDPARLSANQGFFAVHTAFELDELGQVNTQGIGDDVFGGVGGLPDFAGAAARSPRGLSIVALPSSRNGRPTLVEQLSAPPSLGRFDVDVVVTESGMADLRGLSDGERVGALRELWGV